MPTILSRARSKTRAAKYLGVAKQPSKPKYYGSAERVVVEDIFDAYVLMHRLEQDATLWCVLADPGAANAAGLYRRCLRPLPVKRGVDDTDPAGLTVPATTPLLVFDLDDNRWPPGCTAGTPLDTLSAAICRELFFQLDRPACSAIVAYSGNHLVKGCRAKVIVIPDRPLTWERAKYLYCRAGSDTMMSNPALPIYIAPPIPSDAIQDPMVGAPRVHIVPGLHDALDCAERPGDTANPLWEALRASRVTLEHITPGAPRHPLVNRMAYHLGGVAAGLDVPASVVSRALTRLCTTIPGYTDRSFDDEITRGVDDGYVNPIQPIRDELTLTQDGRPQPVMANAAILLSRAVQLRETDMGDQEIVRTPPWDTEGDRYPRNAEEYDLRCATAWLQRTSHAPFRKSDVSDAIAMLAGHNRVNRLTRYLDACADMPRGLVNMDNAAVMGWGAEDTAAHALAVRRFLLQCVARAYEPGCQGELVLVLHAKPGSGKGRSAWQLFTRPGDRYFTSSHISIGNQAQYAPILRGLWGAELGEQRSVSAWHQDVFKAFLSQRKIVYRAPYDRRASDLHLRVNYVWTTEHETPITDDNWRRFLVLGVQRWRELEPADIDALWGDAVRAYKSGERWWLDREDETILAPARELAYDVDSLEVGVAEILHGADMEDNPRAIDAVIRALSMRAHFGVKVSDTQVRYRVAKIMKRLGWSNEPTWLDGKTVRAYRPPSDWVFDKVAPATDISSAY